MGNVDDRIGRARVNVQFNIIKLSCLMLVRERANNIGLITLSFNMVCSFICACWIYVLHFINYSELLNWMLDLVLYQYITGTGFDVFQRNQSLVQEI